jgi:hypothetical protein
MNEARANSRQSRSPRALQSGVLLLALMLVAAPAFASDYRGFISAMAVLCIVAPFALLNLVITLVLALRGGYLKEKNAFRHSMIAAIGPAIGFLTMAFDEFRRDTAILFFVANGVALLLAAIPLVVHNWQEQNAQGRGSPLP